MEQCTHCGKTAQGCEGCGGCGRCGGGEMSISLDRRQGGVLACFAQVPFLPLCGMKGGKGETIPVFLPEPEKAVDLSATAKILQDLAAMGLLTLDYDQPLAGYDYAEYEALALPAPLSARGSMALTPLGQVVLEQLEALL